jgi:hypothetical protein
MSDKTNPKSQRSDDAIAWSVVYKFAKSKDIEIGDSDMSTEQLLEKNMAIRDTIRIIKNNDRFFQSTITLSPRGFFLA